MEGQYFEFMAKVFERGHAVPVPSEELQNQPISTPRMPHYHVNTLSGDCSKASTTGSRQVWYLPHFGVYHPKKPNQIRVVFDSSAEYQGVSLNKELLTGPDQMNILLGVLVRFKWENVAVMCNVEQMFHYFHINPEHRDFLRFLWFKDNDPLKEVIEYRMIVHLFGNGPSPAVATFGLRKTADVGEEEFGAAAKEFVHRDFYVDDGLTSRPSDKEVTELIKSTQRMLATTNLRPHKVVSNSLAVMDALPAEDRAKDIRDVDLRHDVLPTQRSLGVHWALEKDSFTFQVSLPEKPFTRRGVLSINSVYDPLGFVVPVLQEGKLLLRQLIIMGNKKGNNNPLGWDDPLPESLMCQWQTWRNALTDLDNILVPRCYNPKDFGQVILGYIQNESHRFYVYVANRVQMIRNISNPSQWKYIDTATNPANLAIRGITATNLMESRWLSAPEFLRQASFTSPLGEEEIPLNENNPEVQRQVIVQSTDVNMARELGSERCDHFSKWYSLLRAVANLIAKVMGFKARQGANLPKDQKGVKAGHRSDSHRQEQHRFHDQLKGILTAFSLGS